MYQDFLEKAAPNNKPMQPTQPIFTAENEVQIDPQVKQLLVGSTFYLSPLPDLSRCFFKTFMDDFEAVSWCTQLVKKPTFQEDVLRSYRSSILWMSAPERSVNDNVAPRWWRHVAGCRSERFWLLSSHSEKTSSFKLIKQGWGVHRKVPHILKPRLCINEIQQRSISFLQVVLRKTK